MPTLTQTNRPMGVVTPLGADALLLVGFSGHEVVSHLFNYRLELIAPNSIAVPFDQLLGQSVTVWAKLPDGSKRYFNGICNRVKQGERDEGFTTYSMELVPRLWLLSKRTQSRTFQHMSVPDILKKVLGDASPTFRLTGTYQPRDYCAQYRESDVNFASRLMEEEGILLLRA
jgi:type VI secretion system secreted protein VgrG